MKEQNTRQEFICDKCGLESHVIVMPAELVFSVIRKVTAEHEKHSPECDNPTERLRCLNSVNTPEAGSGDNNPEPHSPASLP